MHQWPFKVGTIKMKEVNKVRTDIYVEAIKEAEYLIEHDATIREVAKKFYLSKTTTYKDLTQRLLSACPSLYFQVMPILAKHKRLRVYKGGYATQKKYLQRKLKMVETDIKLYKTILAYGEASNDITNTLRELAHKRIWLLTNINRIEQETKGLE